MYVFLAWYPCSLSTYMGAKSLRSCPTLCDSMDYSPPGSSVLGTLQARPHLSGVPWFPPGYLPYPGIELASLSSNMIVRQVLNPWNHLGSPQLLSSNCLLLDSVLLSQKPEFKSHLSQRQDIDTNHSAQQSAWVANEKEISRKVKNNPVNVSQHLNSLICKTKEKALQAPSMMFALLIKT